MKQTKSGIYTGLITFLMVAFTLACQRLYHHGNIIWNGRSLCLVLLPALISGILAGFVTRYLLLKDLHFSFPPLPEAKPVRRHYLMFFIIWGILFILWIPGFLAYYPGICAYDFQPQMYQIYHGAYNEHHPLIHTLLLEAFWRLGIMLFDSSITGIAFFTLAQILFLSGVFAFVAVTVAKHFGSRRLGIFLGCLFGLYPLHFYLSISITKDIPFAAFMLLSFLSLCLLFSNERTTLKPGKWDLCLFISALGVILFRNNAKYALLLVLALVALMFLLAPDIRRLLLRVGTTLTLSCITGILCLQLLSNITAATQGDKKEMFSIPMQQFARVVAYHEEELNPETMDYLCTLIHENALHRYKACLSDPVKNGFVTSEVLRSPKAFLCVYLDLLCRYPGDYVNAFLALYAGFLDPLDISANYINHNGSEVPEGLYYVQTVFYEEDMAKFDIVQHPILSGLHTFMEYFANSDLYRRIPVLRLIMVPGTFLWCFLYLLGVTVYRHGRKYILPFAFVLFYFLTLFAGPTVQLRYLYPIILCLPIALLFTCKKPPRS